MEEVYVSFECTAKLYFRGPQQPVEHRCRLTLGATRQQNSNLCILTIEGRACQRRTFRVTKENISNVVARLGNGSMTLVLRHSCCDSLVVKEVVDRSALTLCHKIVYGIWMGIEGNVGKGGLEKFVSPPAGLLKQATGESSGDVSANSKRKIQLSLKRRYGDTRGGKMLEAAQSKPATTSSFYKTDSPVSTLSEQFLPQTTPTSSPYFQRVARRNLNLELSNEKREQQTSEDKQLTPRDHSQGGREFLGPRRAAVLARKRLPLGDVQSHHDSSSPKDYLTFDEPVNRDGFANLGNTCYMNAVLQVLLGLEPFAEDLLNQLLINNIGPQSLLRMMYLLLKSKRAKDSYDSQRVLLKKIKSAIEASRPKFSGYRQQDAHELLTQCLDQLKDDSKHVKITQGLPEDKNCEVFSVCPVVRNFECEMCRSIKCKSCDKVTEVNEVIYDFALQLPKSVLWKANEQANLQDLLDAFFVSEEVEYKCPVCSCNSATMSCRLARLPRVIILFLKRYGYNASLSRNSKRIDFIRIPRFIAVGHLSSETTKPPLEYKGPWARDSTTSSSSADDKENLPSSSKGTNQAFPGEAFHLGIHRHELALGNTSSLVLGKRRSSERLDVVEQGSWEQSDYDVTKKQKTEQQVSVSQSASSQLLSDGRNSITQNGSDSALGDHHTSISGVATSGTTRDSSGRQSVADTRAGKLTASDDPTYSQSSVGRDIAAEFDSLFSPEVLFEFDNNSPLTATTNVAVSNTCTTIATSTSSAAQCTTVASSNQSVTSSHVVRPQVAMSGTASCETASEHASTRHPGSGGTGSAAQHSEHPLPQPGSDNNEQESLMLGLFGGVSSTRSTPPGSCGHPPDTSAEEPHRAANSGPLYDKDEEDEGLQKAVEESMKGESSQAVLLEQMGLSEEVQLRLALELSMQEQCVEECPMEQQSNEHADLETPTTQDVQKPETYKLMGIVNHIGKASSGGHYISDVCSAQDGVWRSYNDSHVHEAREEDIRQKRQGTGYIFFYMHKSILGSISCNDKRTT